VVGEFDSLKQHIVVGYFPISVCGIGKLIVVDFPMGVLVYFYFLFCVILGVIYFVIKKKLW